MPKGYPRIPLTPEQKAERSRSRRYWFLKQHGSTEQEIDANVLAGNRWCSACKVFHEPGAFYTGSSVCKEKHYSYIKEYLVEYRTRRKDKVSEWKRGTVARMLGYEDRKTQLNWYEQQLASQDGMCAICGTASAGGRWNKFNADHDHNCCPAQKTCLRCRRGLLCSKCNTALERIESVPGWEQKAISYLKQYAREKENVA